MQGVFEDTELGYELVECHHLVLFDPSELCTHYSVEHLIEIDEAIVDLDAHLEDDALYVHLTCNILNIHVHQHAFGEPSEKVAYILDLHTHALVTARIMFPRPSEVLEVDLESGQRVVNLDVVFGELLDDDQDEQIEHNMRYDQDEGHEE